MNIGLALMVGLSLLPIGLMQTWASVEHGLWFARSAEFLQQPLIETLRWLRIIGDSVFLFGVAAFTWFMAGLLFGWSYEPAGRSLTVPVGAVAPSGVTMSAARGGRES
jgi:nitric oxide reductase subunit B